MLFRSVQSNTRLALQVPAEVSVPCTRRMAPSIVIIYCMYYVDYTRYGAVYMASYGILTLALLRFQQSDPYALAKSWIFLNWSACNRNTQTTTAEGGTPKLKFRDRNHISSYWHREARGPRSQAIGHLGGRNKLSPPLCARHTPG